MNKTELRQNLKEITALFLCFAVIAVGTVFFIDPARLYNFELTASAAEAAPEGPEAIPAEEEPGPERFAVDTEGITAGPMTVALRDYANSIEPQPEQTGAAPTLSQQ